jgi:hypothetical protein
MLFQETSGAAFQAIVAGLQIKRILLSMQDRQTASHATHVAENSFAICCLRVHYPHELNDQREGNLPRWRQNN